MFWLQCIMYKANFTYCLKKMKCCVVFICLICSVRNRWLHTPFLSHTYTPNVLWGKTFPIEESWTRAWSWHTPPWNYNKEQHYSDCQPYMSLILLWCWIYTILFQRSGVSSCRRMYVVFHPTMPTADIDIDSGKGKRCYRENKRQWRWCWRWWRWRWWSPMLVLLIYTRGRKLVFILGDTHNSITRLVNKKLLLLAVSWCQKWQVYYHDNSFKVHFQEEMHTKIWYM